MQLRKIIKTSIRKYLNEQKMLNDKLHNTLLDGELIMHDKNGEFINLYAAFDIYFSKNKDVRHFTFLLREEEKDMY
jgi:hypothetical protein